MNNAMNEVPATRGRSGEVAREDPEQLVGFLAEATMRAPSVHNTQPWWFGFCGPRVSLHADADRRLEVADPDGREMLVSCGAALFTLRLAARRLGYEPDVRVLPDPDRPNLLADVTLGEQRRASDAERELYGQIRRRRTHRGAFGAAPLRPALLARLREEARAEGAELRVVEGAGERAALAALTEAAEQIQRMNPAYDAELARWAPAPGSRRTDGVHAGSYPHDPGRVEPHFAARDFARGQGWGNAGAGEAAARPEPRAKRAAAVPPAWRAPVPGTPVRRPVTGIVAVLTTPVDSRADWLRAGQALQRLLLHACADGAAAAFHAQALEVPELREFVRNRFCEGAYPQMLLRLGIPDPGTGRGPGAEEGAEAGAVRAAGEAAGSPRRPSGEVMVPEL